MTSTDTPVITMHHSEAHGALPAWVWRAIATSRRDAGDSMPVTILREGKPAKPFDSRSSLNGLVVIDLHDWHRLLDVLDGAERVRRR